MKGAAEADRTTRPAAGQGRGGTSLARRLVWPALALFLLLAFNALRDESFLSVSMIDGRPYGPLLSILAQAAKIMLVAVGMTLVIATGGVDLSVGSVMAICGGVAALAASGGAPGSAALGAGLAAGLVVGLLNGSLVAWLRIQPIVATLIFMVLGRGVAMRITDGQPIPISDPVLLALGDFAPVLVAVVFAGTLAALRLTASGLFISAVGDNERASRLSGLRGARIKLLVYAFSGFCAAVAGIMAAARVERADATRLGELVELDAIFAVVVGGTALTGGRFTLVGSMIGALLIQTLTFTMIGLGVPPEITPVPKAIVIVLVCLLQSEEFRRAVRRLAAGASGRRHPGSGGEAAEAS